MERFEPLLFSALVSSSFLISSVVFSLINRGQRTPYMDEIFHVPQAQRYCDGRFSEWDPMITTLPGLYLVSTGIIKPVSWLMGWTGTVVCSTGMLRFINLLFSTGNLYLLYLLLCKIHQKNKVTSAFQRIVSALALASFPLLYFFSFLYYTDAGSTFFILFTYLMCLYGSHSIAACLGFCAFMFRQSNIIWIVFCAGSVVAQKLTEAWRIDSLKKKDEKTPAVPNSAAEIKKIVQFILEYTLSLNNLKSLILLTWPYIILVLGFLLFVFLNGGIVVGDRASHEISLNFPQLFYFFSFTLVFSVSHLLSPHKVASFLYSVKKHPLFYIGLVIVSLLLVWKFTYVHKFLLADNRHYTFYVWKNIFQRHELIKYVLVPGYIFAAWVVIETLKSKSIFWNLVFFICLTAATVPQKLLEFRYFIVPYLIYRLNIPMPLGFKILAELALYSLVNVLTIYLFLNKTFQWPDRKEVQRFMW
ncbi:dol-P-Glc:Glc(2)Man(9)GlcNAc(2)-PP-Dol alpha-1,2-glucosyltransferase isoform X1 [Carcharodon carcharias]|uniref:dol-P-Glc:Glc(2)Man(9)GlcNAc(2)-PP-Dol alpha-1,2-glucosyltransferase isoform X1 n=1 Tax=Carcharodon carcharias TaxID=13397 RepID=UPI001B7F66B7|nr:dol-P-Glc:Glc(2)Man(9)GlcNAc(2)-PP-Dol alpha-1,2-glucosyltransferase isoform X1 [Carcharodon carcharias]